MNPSSLGAGALCALLATTCLASGAHAQTANIAPPAEKFAVAPGGVDMRSGRYVYNQTDLSIGADSGGVQLTRTLAQQVVGHTNPFANFSHNWDVMVTEKKINLTTGIMKHTVGQPDYQIEFNFGGRSQTFRAYAAASFDNVSRAGFAQISPVISTNATRAGAGLVYTLVTDDGTTAVFRPMGSADCSSVIRCAYVSDITDADGTKLTFGYDAPGGTNATRLRSVTSNRGYALLFEYAGALVSKACVLNLTIAPKPANNVCPAGVPTSIYAYENVAGETRLASATDAGGGVWGFVNGLESIGFVKPGQPAPWLTNMYTNKMNDEGLVTQIVYQQNFADGSRYDYGFFETPPVKDQLPSIAGGTFSDAQGHTTTLRYDFPIKPHGQQGYGNVDGGGFNEPTSPIVFSVTPGPVEVTDPLGRVTTSDYCDPYAAANLPATERNRCVLLPLAVSTTDPELITTKLSWDFASRTLLKTEQIAKPQEGQLPPAPIVKSATYDCTPANVRFCTKPVSVTDAKNNVSNYTYSPAHGGVLTETLPAATPSGPRPQKRYTYQQRTAWISNGAGGYVQAGPPVWLLTSMSLCKTGAAAAGGTGCANGPSDEVVTTYDYGPDAGPNNLILRGTVVDAGGLNLRSCSTTDAQGNTLSQTSANAGLTSCPNQ
jgi:hypothetical protein